MKIWGQELMCQQGRVFGFIVLVYVKNNSKEKLGEVSKKTF